MESRDSLGEEAHHIMNNFKVFSIAESLGGVESLACHPATMTHAAVPAEARQEAGVVDSLIRLSVGVEDGGDLLNDLEQALAYGLDILIPRSRDGISR